MGHTLVKIRAFAGTAAIAVFGFGSLANAAPITATYVGADCPDVCVDLASAGYTVTGGAVIDPAISINNVAKRPGTDTGNQAAVVSYNVTSSINDPQGAISPVVVTDLADAFGLYWGSVDSYNIVEFFFGENLVDSFSGADANSLANVSGVPANYNFDGYFTFSGQFDRVVLSSGGGVAFEFATVPEPGPLALLGLGLVGLGVARRRKC